MEKHDFKNVLGRERIKYHATLLPSIGRLVLMTATANVKGTTCNSRTSCFQIATPTITITTNNNSNDINNTPNNINEDDVHKKQELNVETLQLSKNRI